MCNSSTVWKEDLELYVNLKHDKIKNNKYNQCDYATTITNTNGRRDVCSYYIEQVRIRFIVSNRQI
jgi:hypothetical protein